MQNYVYKDNNGRVNLLENKLENTSKDEIIINNLPVKIVWNESISNTSTRTNTPSRGDECIEYNGIRTGLNMSTSINESIMEELITIKIKNIRIKNGIDMHMSYINAIRMEITKNNDISFFLYTEINNNREFELLKNTQRLLVNFDKFPKMISDLLSKVRTKTMPLRLVLNITTLEKGYFGITNSLSNIETCTLNIIEENHYKEILHLFLNFNAPNEEIYREYLIYHIKNYSEIAIYHNNKLNESEQKINELIEENKLLGGKFTDLKNRLSDSETIYNKEVKNIELYYDNELKKIKNEYEYEINEILKQSNNERMDSESKIMELSKQFTEISGLYELIKKSKASLEENIKLNNENNNNNLKRIHILEQEKLELEIKINKLQEDYDKLNKENEQTNKNNGINANSIKKLKTALEDSCMEIEKGNTIINTLQTSLNTLDEKYKHSLISNTNLKRNYEELEDKYKLLNEKYGDNKEKLENSMNRQDQLIQDNERLRSILTDAEKQIEINQNVIKTLKSQLSGIEHNENNNTIINNNKVKNNSLLSTNRRSSKSYSRGIRNDKELINTLTQPRRSYSWTNDMFNIDNVGNELNSYTPVNRISTIPEDYDLNLYSSFK